MKKSLITNLTGTPFQKLVWTELTKIPKGKVITYQELAKRIGKPGAYRTVANAVGKNPLAPTIPCHSCRWQSWRLFGQRWYQDQKKTSSR